MPTSLPQETPVAQKPKQKEKPNFEDWVFLFFCVLGNISIHKLFMEKA